MRGIGSRNYRGEEMNEIVEALKRVKTYLCKDGGEVDKTLVLQYVCLESRRDLGGGG